MHDNSSYEAPRGLDDASWHHGFFNLFTWAALQPNVCLPACLSVLFPSACLSMCDFLVPLFITVRRPAWIHIVSPCMSVCIPTYFFLLSCVFLSFCLPYLTLVCLPDFLVLSVCLSGMPSCLSVWCPNPVSLPARFICSCLLCLSACLPDLSAFSACLLDS